MGIAIKRARHSPNPIRAGLEVHGIQTIERQAREEFASHRGIRAEKM
jgi:hypothetical protein